MANELMCKIVTPEQTVFESEATYVRLPGEKGSFGVMLRHEPFVSALQPGLVMVTAPGAGKETKTTVVVSGGYAQISDDKVIVLADKAVNVDTIGVAGVKAELDKVKQTLAGIAADDVNAAYYKSQKEWFELQLKAVSAE